MIGLAKIYYWTGARQTSNRLREGQVQVKKGDKVPLVHTCQLLPHLLHLPLHFRLLGDP